MAKFDWKSILLMYDDFEKVRKVKPNIDFEKYYLCFVYNLLDQDKVGEAEAIMTDIPEFYFRSQVIEDLDTAFDFAQKTIEIENKLKDRFLYIEERQELEQDLEYCRQQSEIFIVIADLPEMSEKNPRLHNSDKIQLLKDALKDKTYLLNMGKGLKPPTNH